jgi:hypothetical protein
VRVRNRPTRVTYPMDGLSHINEMRDNLRISRMHAAQYFCMLLRLPVILANRWRRA